MAAPAKNRYPEKLRFGRANIGTNARGLWEYDAAGPEAVVLNVADRHGEPRDLAAWRPEDPWVWWLRNGEGVLLGEDQIGRSEALGTPLTVFSTPQQWLFARGRGICVLRWDSPLSLWIGGVDRIVTDTHELADKINDALGRHSRMRARALNRARCGHAA